MSRYPTWENVPYDVVEVASCVDGNTHFGPQEWVEDMKILEEEDFLFFEEITTLMKVLVHFVYCEHVVPWLATFKILPQHCRVDTHVPGKRELNGQTMVEIYGQYHACHRAV